MSVYLIEARNGLVKIGCANAPEHRLSVIAGHSPIPVRLIAVLPGHFEVEGELHRRFAAYRENREWFRLSGDFADFVDRHRGAGLSGGVVSWDAVVTADRQTRQRRGARNGGFASALTKRRNRSASPDDAAMAPAAE